MRLQLLFERVKENGETFITFCPNHDILPSYGEIDAIIGRLERLKLEMTDEEIAKHNSIKEKEFEEELLRYRGKTEKIERKKERGFIYILKSLEIYKIGRAKHLDSRIKAYKTENPHGIELLHQKEVDDYISVESNLLMKFKEKQVRGEWFKLSIEDIEWIKNNI
jgi:hypothetical protein